MALTQSIELASAVRIGPDGVTEAVLAEALARTAPALAWIRDRHADGKLPLLRLPERTDDIAAVADVARRLGEGASDIVFLGTGGSSLGGQTLAQLAGHGCPASGCCATGRACTSWTISMATPMRRFWRACRSQRRDSSRCQNPAPPPKL